MKGVRKFLGETWWLFAGVASAAIVAAYVTEIWIYYLFPPALVIVAIYMGMVRYDADGLPREERRMR